MKCLLWISASILVVMLLGGAVLASQFNLSALPEPGKTETLLAAKAKRLFYSKGQPARNSSPAQGHESESGRRRQALRNGLFPVPW